MSSAGDAITKYSWGDGKKQAGSGIDLGREALRWHWASVGDGSGWSCGCRWAGQHLHRAGWPWWLHRWHVPGKPSFGGSKWCQCQLTYWIHRDIELIDVDSWYYYQSAKDKMVEEKKTLKLSWRLFKHFLQRFGFAARLAPNQWLLVIVGSIKCEGNVWWEWCLPHHHQGFAACLWFFKDAFSPVSPGCWQEKNIHPEGPCSWDRRCQGRVNYGAYNLSQRTLRFGFVQLCTSKLLFRQVNHKKGKGSLAVIVLLRHWSEPWFVPWT